MKNQMKNKNVWFKRVYCEAAMRERAGVSCGEGEEKKKIRHRDVVDSLTMVS